MSNWIIEVEGNCTNPDRIKEFHDWYNNVHIPDILLTPGFISATRWELEEGAADKGSFLALYEIETDDIKSFLEAHNKNMNIKRNQGRFTDLFTLKSRGVYKKIFSIASPKK